MKTVPGEAFVLDSYAVLAYLQAEADGGKVVELLRLADAGEATLAMSVVNLGEVLYMTERRRGADAVDEVLTALQRLPVSYVPADIPAVQAAARFKARHRISFADGFAAALAQSLDATVVTGDPEFRALEGQVRVLWLGDGG